MGNVARILDLFSFVVHHICPESLVLQALLLDEGGVGEDCNATGSYPETQPARPG